MPDTGWVLPGAHSTENTTSSGTGSISNPLNAYDGSLATFCYLNPTDKSSDSLALLLTDFGMGSLIPSGSTLDGMEVRWSFTGTGTDVEYLYIHHITELNPTEYSTITPYKVNKDAAAPFTAIWSPFSNGAETHVFGSSTDTWQASLTLADIDSADFGFAVHLFGVSGTRISAFECKVYYTEGASDPMSVRDTGVWKSASPFVKDAGVWKPATPSIRTGGVWKAS